MIWLEVIVGVLTATKFGEWIGLWVEFKTSNEPNITTIENIVTIEKTKYEKMKNIISITKVERVKLKKLNDELIIQGINYLDIFKQKDVEIDKLKNLIDQYETALVNRDKDNKEMIKILDKYKNNLQKLLDWKNQAIKTMDSQAIELSRLKNINIKMLAELKKYKQD